MQQAILDTVAPAEFTAYLDQKVKALLRKVEASEVYRLIADPSTDRRLVTAVVKHILLEVFSYGPHVTEATFTAIGRFPKTRPDLMRPLIKHDLAEVDHGEMALRDYVRLGGDEAYARSRRITPTSFVMAATCRMLAEHEAPFAYLGYMYPFEALTPVLTARAQVFLSRHGYPAEARRFIDVHAEEDVAHAAILKDCIEEIIVDYPEAAAAIDYGFECFTRVYPLPIWKAALDHARAELAMHGND